jgi:hypothetical protein
MDGESNETLSERLDEAEAKIALNGYLSFGLAGAFAIFFVMYQMHLLNIDHSLILISEDQNSGTCTTLPYCDLKRRRPS